ncbi:MAG: DUF4258 domain-containing protein [Bacteroidetes bacterium]|nr:DUF4258 domain-containing protein [Bacteroidota bacterium]MBI3765020.1 DUF4258 domain-containing protein [Ignavibacteriales bacterium]
MDIKKVQKALRKKFYFTHHAVEKMIERKIDDAEIQEAIENGEIIEEYPKDKYGPTCLIYGLTKVRRPLHVLISYSEPLWIITAYEPKESEWINYTTRREK